MPLALSTAAPLVPVRLSPVRLSVCPACGSLSPARMFKVIGLAALTDAVCAVATGGFQVPVMVTVVVAVELAPWLSATV